MAPLLPPLRLTGARILRDGELQQRSIALAEGRITRGPLPEVDLSGFLVLPGIIDLHGDGFERHLTPRPGASFPMPAGLASYDREAAASGVTTAYLAQGWSWEGGLRGPDQAEALLAALASLRREALADLRVQIRAETHLTNEAPRLLEAVRRWGVGYVVFNDHLDQGLQMHRQEPAAFIAWARKLGVDPAALVARMEAARAAARAVPRQLCRLAEGFDALGVSYGSHDDRDGETREFYSMIGARIAEFPKCRSAACAAHSMMNPVIMGAPNVVRGGSHSGSVSAVDLVADGVCDALVSDYHLPALALAAWRLVDRGVLSLPKAWQMISAAPAQILRLADRGRLDAGLRADMVIVHADSRRIEATICGGRLVWLSGEAALRFLRQPQALRMAAE